MSIVLCAIYATWFKARRLEGSLIISKLIPNILVKKGYSIYNDVLTPKYPILKPKLGFEPPHGVESSIFEPPHGGVESNIFA